MIMVVILRRKIYKYKLLLSKDLPSVQAKPEIEHFSSEVILNLSSAQSWPIIAGLPNATWKQNQFSKSQFCQFSILIFSLVCSLPCSMYLPAICSTVSTGWILFGRCPISPLPSTLCNSPPPTPLLSNTISLLQYFDKNLLGWYFLFRKNSRVIW